MPSHYTYGLNTKEKAEIVSVGSAGAGLTAILIGASLPIIGSVVGLIASAYMISRNSKINKNTTEDYFLHSKKDDTLEVACKYDWLNDQYKAKLPTHLSLNDYGDKLTEYMKKNPKSKIGIKNEEENADKYSLYDITKKASICEILSSPNYINKLKQKYEKPVSNAPAEDVQEPSAPSVQEPQNPVNDEEETEDLESLIPQAPVMQPQTSSHKFKEYLQDKWKYLGTKKDKLKENMKDKLSQYKDKKDEIIEKMKYKMSIYKDKKDEFIENIKSKIKERKTKKTLAQQANLLQKASENLETCIIN